MVSYLKRKKKLRRKSKKNSVLGKLEKECRRAWLVAVFKKYGKYCEVCGEPAYTAHHFFRFQAYPPLRYELANGVPICQRCHTLHHLTGDPAPHILIKDKRGTRWFNRLNKMRYKEIYFTVKYFNKQIKKLRK